MRLSRREVTINYAILGFFALLTVLPLYGLVSTAIESQNAIAPQFGFPAHIHLSNFVDAWNVGGLGHDLLSSLIVSSSATVLCCFLSLLTGYAFATMDFRGRNLLFAVMLLGIIVPEEAIIVPQYFELRSVGLAGTYWSLILPQAAAILSFGTFWMRNFFRTLPPSLLDAAAVDGANSWQTLWRVLVPLSRPAVLTMATLVFMWTWNEFLYALVMLADRPNLSTAPLGLSVFKGAHTTDYALLAAAAMIVAAPVVALYFFFQRQFIAGMLSGAVKE